MKDFGPRFFLVLLVAAAAFALACGSSPSSSSTRVPQAITLTPATASGGQVQFTATGYFTSMPSPVTPITATWGVCDLAGNTTTEVTVSASGLAQCSTGASGSYTVWAFDVNPSTATCNVINACGGGCGRVTGTAQLTCQ
jgi:hypothetical protein